MKNNNWLKYSLVMLMLTVLVLIVFEPSRTYSFAPIDDFLYVTENTAIQNGLNGDSISWAFTTFEAGNWHPLTWLSHALDVQLFGLNPAGHHITNVVFHLLNVLILFLFLTYATGSFWRSALLAGLFAVHPLRAESVAWVSERKDVLSAFFYFLSLWAYVWYAKKPTRAKFSAVFVLLCFGVMSKPMSVSAPLVMLLLDYWPLNRLNLNNPNRDELFSQWKKLLIEKAPLLIPVFAAGILTVLAQSAGGAMASSDVLPMGSRLANAVYSSVQYLRKFYFPNDLAYLYPHPYAPEFHGHKLLGLSLTQLGVSAIVLLGITWFAVQTRKKYPFVIVGWLWYLITLLPVIGIISVGAQGMADRYTYIPIVGFMIGLFWVVTEWVREAVGQKFKIAAAALVIFCVCWIGVMTYFGRVQANTWKDSMSLNLQAARVTDGNWVANASIADELEAKGELEQAIPYWKNAVKFRSGFGEGCWRMATIYMKLKRYNEAVPELEKAVEYEPNMAEYWAALAEASYSAGLKDKALNAANKAIELDGRYADRLKSIKP